MAITRSALGHTVTITNIPATSFVDTRQNVKKRLFTFRFNESVPEENVNMYYISAEEAHADNNLFISDKSTIINENSPGFLIEEQTFDGPTFSTFFKNFLLTDVFTPDTVTRPSEPLYFRHTLDSNVDPNSVVILDKNFSPVDGNLYVIDRPYTYNETTGLANDGDGGRPLEYEAIYVYNNLENTYDEETAEYEVYYVGYADISTGNSVHALLDNSNVFHSATFDDIWLITSNLKPWVKAYQIAESAGSFNLTLPTSNTYALKSLDAARIFVQEPIDKQSTEPWFLRVTNGSFETTYNLQSYVYSLPEFSAQNFNPIEPYKLIIGEESLRITDHLILLKRPNLQVDPDNGFNIDVVILDQNDNVLSAITTNEDKIGTFYVNNLGEVTDIIWTTEEIDSVDTKSGFIYLSSIIKDTYKLSVTYYFVESTYEFTTINFNPTQNSSILTERVVLYLVPENAIYNNNDSHSGALHFLKVAPDGRITYTSQSGDDGNDNLKTGSEYMIEAASRHSTRQGGISHVFWVNSPAIHMGMYYDNVPDRAPDATVPSDPDAIAHKVQVFIKGQISPKTFLDEFTVRAANGEEGLNRRYVVLAEIFVNEHLSIDDVTLLDTRVRGGGIKESKVREALERNPEVQWYHDIGVYDGKPFPGTSVVIVKIPYTVLQEFGGLLSRDQVRQIVKRHMALGSYPVIRYYGVVPNLTAITSGNGSLKLYWDSEGSSYGYNVYYSNSKDGPYIKYNSSLITDDPSGNSLQIDGLTNKVKYWVTVSAVNIYTDVESPRAVALIAKPLVIKRLTMVGHTVNVTI